MGPSSLVPFSPPISFAQEEQSKATSEVARLRDQLRTVRGESARRGRALQLLQGIIPSSQQRAGGEAGASADGMVASSGAPSAGGSLAEQFDCTDDSTRAMDFEAVAKAASSSAAASAKEAEGERSARLAAEAKLKECRQTIERKTSVIRSGNGGFLVEEGRVIQGEMSCYPLIVPLKASDVFPLTHQGSSAEGSRA